MRHNYETGDNFTMSEAALENYGEQYRDQVFTVRQWFDHYTPAAQMKWGDTNDHGHPGFDEGADSALYEADGINFALYEWEMRDA